jgi:hypothetical protein
MTEKPYDQVIAIFDKLDSDKKRADLIAIIGTYYCLRCGKHQSTISRCSCLNREVNMIPAAKVEKHTGQLKDMAIVVWLDKQPPEGTILYMKN